VKRESDGKIIMVSRQKVRVHESLYIGPLSHLTTLDEINSNIIGDQSPSSSDLVTKASISESSNFDNESSRPETDNNAVQSVKYLRNHRQKMIGTSKGKMLDIEESAMFGNVDSLHEGLYTDSVICSDADKIALEVEEEIKKGGSMKEALLKAIRKTSKTISNGGLARGKNKAATGDITDENIIESKRKKNRVEKFVRLNSSGQPVSPMLPKRMLSKTRALKSGEQNSPKLGPNFRKGKGKLVAKVGDLISVKPEIFDDETGAYSKENPGLIFGTVDAIALNGIAKVTWVDDGSFNFCKLRDLTVVKSKRDVKSVVAGIIALLVKGKPIKTKKNQDFPKDFFEVLVREDWRKWVEAVKKRARSLGR
jgi:hypothetical protein